MGYTIGICLLSGAEDGTVLKLNSEQDGELTAEGWTIRIGRQETCDLRLTKDIYVSRTHACLHLRDGIWFIEDLNSKNGTFMPNTGNFFDDERIFGERLLPDDQIFRVGRTWIRLQHTQHP